MVILYIIGLEPTGEFRNQTNKIAQRNEHSWRFITPHKWLEVTYNKDGTKYQFTGKEWQQVVSGLLPMKPESKTTVDYLIKKDSGEYLQVLHLQEECKLLGEFTESIIKIPHHSIVIAVNIRVIEEITGTNSFSIGTSDNSKLYGNNIASVKDTTNIGLTNHPLTYWNDTSIRITADENRFITGIVHLSFQLLKPHGAWNWE